LTKKTALFGHFGGNPKNPKKPFYNPATVKKKVVHLASCRISIYRAIFSVFFMFFAHKGTKIVKKTQKNVENRHI
jgi:hypothetical protein